MNEIAANPMENISSLITFQLGGELFCADMQNIVQIIDPAELQEKDLNSENSHINLGVIQIPIIDLHKIAGLKLKKISRDNRILVINIDYKDFGIWVEKVDNIYTLNHGIEIEIEYNESEEALYLKGILKFKNKKMFLLNLKGLSLTDRNIV